MACYNDFCYFLYYLCACIINVYKPFPPGSRLFHVLNPNSDNDLLSSIDLSLPDFFDLGTADLYSATTASSAMPDIFVFAIRKIKMKLFYFFYTSRKLNIV